MHLAPVKDSPTADNMYKKCVLEARIHPIPVAYALLKLWRTTSAFRNIKQRLSLRETITSDVLGNYTYTLPLSVQL